MLSSVCLRQTLHASAVAMLVSAWHGVCMPQQTRSWSSPVCSQAGCRPCHVVSACSCCPPPGQASSGMWCLRSVGQRRSCQHDNFQTHEPATQACVRVLCKLASSEQLGAQCVGQVGTYCDASTCSAVSMLSVFELAAVWCGCTLLEAAAFCTCSAPALKAPARTV